MKEGTLRLVMLICQLCTTKLLLLLQECNRNELYLGRIQRDIPRKHWNCLWKSANCHILDCLQYLAASHWFSMFYVLFYFFLLIHNVFFQMYWIHGNNMWHETLIADFIDEMLWRFYDYVSIYSIYWSINDHAYILCYSEISYIQIMRN